MLMGVLVNPRNTMSKNQPLHNLDINPGYLYSRVNRKNKDHPLGGVYNQEELKKVIKIQDKPTESIP